MVARGFTLVESLIVTAVLVGIGAAVWVLSQTNEQMGGRMDARLASLTMAQQAINRLTADLQRADQASIDDACDPATPTVLTFTQAGGATQLSYTFDAEAGTLTRTQDAIGQVIATDVTDFSRSCPGDGLAVISLTVQARVPGGYVAPQTLRTQVRAMVPGP